MPPYSETGKGFPIVLLHAFPLSGAMWSTSIKALVKDGYRVIVPDLPGFGANTEHARVTGMRAAASGIADLLSSLKIKRACFLGLSMGGYVLFEFVRSFPKIPSALVFCDTTCRADTEEKRLNRQRLVESISELGMDALASDMLPNLLGERTKTENRALVEYMQKEFRECEPAAAKAALRGMAERRDSCPVLGEINVPTLLIFGEEDRATDLACANELLHGIRNSRLSLISDAGHFSNLEQPEAFNSTLRSFLNSLELT